MEYQIKNISPNELEQCVKCTVCTVYCPMVSVNPRYPGPKQAGPDGERYRLKTPDFYDFALKYCLNCKRCEVACPNGVRIGDIIQTARIKYDTSAIKLRDRILASTDFVGRMANRLAPIVNTMLGLGISKKLMDATLKIDGHRTFPAYSSQRFTTWFRREAAGKQAQFANQMAYFHGCYVNYNYPQLGKDLVRVMNAIGYGVQLLDDECCCGVAKISNRMVDQARRDAQRNLKAIRKAAAAGLTVAGTGSTCIFTMRDEYPHLLGIDNSDVRDNIVMATAMIYRLVESGKVKLAFKPDYRHRTAYHTPCHMQKLGWAIYSLSLLRLIPGLEVVPLESMCCGIAGTYGFKKENYAYSQAIGQELFEQIEESGADFVATDCETCKWQIEMSTGKTVKNPISILAEALDLEETSRLNNGRKQ